MNGNFAQNTVSMSKLTSDYQMRIWFPVWFEGATKTERESESSNQTSTTKHISMLVRQSIQYYIQIGFCLVQNHWWQMWALALCAAYEWECIVYILLCVMLRWIFTHIKFNLTGSVNGIDNPKKAMRELPSTRKQFTTSEWKDLFVRVNFLVFSFFSLSWVELSYELKWRAMGTEDRIKITTTIEHMKKNETNVLKHVSRNSREYRNWIKLLSINKMMMVCVN